MQYYLETNASDIDLFDFDITKSGFAGRLKYLKENDSYNREELCDRLIQFNRQFTNSIHVFNNIEKLRKNESYVVVGGQQAGLLTGPLYTIHKIITLICLAKEKSKELSTDVIPVFWIAGEDHDYNEVNHVYSFNTSFNKISLTENNQIKRIISKTDINYEKVTEFIDRVFKDFGETEHSNAVLDDIHCCLKVSKTFSDFFTLLISKMFSEHGLVLFDSGSDIFTNMKTPFLKKLVEKEDIINCKLIEQKDVFKYKGFKPSLDIRENVINIFYEVNGERQYVEKNQDGTFRIKGYKPNLTKEDLLDLIDSESSLFTNNVATRPLMQEYLFPVLAFVGGPGEISYWAELKGTFNEIGMKMPIVYPRYSITFLEKNIEAYANEFMCNLQESDLSHIDQEMNSWFINKTGVNVEDEISKSVDKFIESHNLIRNLGDKIGPGFEPLLDKNFEKILEQVNYMKNKYQNYLDIKHEAELNKWKKLCYAVYPLDGPQERLWNVFYFINKYGVSFIDELLHIEKFDEKKHNFINV
jgi:bacillithiol biosynthesis cysteine-adding enzyme BshC